MIVSSLVHFDYFPSKARYFAIIYLNFQKHLFINEVSKNFEKYPTPSKALITPCKKIGNKDGFVSFFVTKYYFPATYHPNIKAIFFAIV